jgi:isoquinoline 1-oxidoreductase subunit alpha
MLSLENAMSDVIQVNGQTVPLTAQSASEPLLWVLREDLGLVGTKFGCGQGMCGACTVHVDGAAVRACLTSCESVKGRAITTVEGLAMSGKLHAVQRAWAELRVPQCGYCQAGQMMSAAALLRTTPEPSDAQIDEAMAGNLCRCGTYDRIRAAIKRAAALAKEVA